MGNIAMRSMPDDVAELAIGDDSANNYEKVYLRRRIAITEQALSPQG